MGVALAEPDDVRPAVPHAVAVDDVVVHAQPEVQELLRTGHAAEQHLVVAAQPEEGGRDQPGPHELAAVGGTSGVDELGHLRAGRGRPAAHLAPELGREQGRLGHEPLHARGERGADRSRDGGGGCRCTGHAILRRR